MAAAASRGYQAAAFSVNTVAGYTSILSVDSVQSLKPQQRPMLTVRVGSSTVLALADSGSKVTAMSESAFLKITQELSRQGVMLKQFAVDPVNIVSASNHTMKIDRAYYAPFSIEGIDKPWRMFVLPNLSCQLILGQDFLSNYGASIDCRSHKISWSQRFRRPCAIDQCYMPSFVTPNKFQALSELSAFDCEPHPIHCKPHTPSPKRSRVRSQGHAVQSNPSDLLLHALNATKIPLSPNPKDTPGAAYLSPDQTIELSSLSSSLHKLMLHNRDGSHVRLSPGKRVGIVDGRGPLVTINPSVVVTNGLSNVYVDKNSRAYTYVQLTNIDLECVAIPRLDFVSSIEFLDPGTSLHEISVVDALCKSSTPSKITAEKEKYLREKITISSPTEFANSYMQLALEFHDIFASHSNDIGHTDLVTHHIHMKDPNQAPIYRKQFPIPWEHQQFISEKVTEMLQQGVIEESLSPYNSPIFAVKKPHGGGLRLVIDMRKINQASHCTSFRVRCVQECIDEVSKHKSQVFSTLDISSAFYHISLHKNSRPYTAFTVPGKGSFHFARLPMGLHSSPAALSRVTNHVIKDIKEAIAYLDDLIIHSRDHVQHLRLLRKLFERLRRYGLRLQPKKCELGAREVTYLGYTISADGVKAGAEKTQAIAEFPVPRTSKQIRQFCGLANYFRHMIPKFSLHSAQLTKLLTRKENWRSGNLPEESLKSFHHLRSELAKAPLLQFPDPNKVFSVYTDASLGTPKTPGGLGAVLCQHDENGYPRPVAYASRTLKDNEKSYSAFLLEMSAIVFAITHWHTYLYGRFFRVFCDHKPIEKLGLVHKRTINRLQELMLDYNFELQYNPGSQNCPADALSRNPISALGADVDIPSAQKEDNFCQEMLRYLEHKILPSDNASANFIIRHAPSCHVTENGTLVYCVRRERFRPRQVIVVPASYRIPLVQAAHASRFSGHQGVFKTLNRLLITYWWPGMQADVSNFIRECHNCQLTKNPGGRKQTFPLQPLPIPDSFNSRIHIDTVGKMKATSSPWLLVITCAFSKYVVPIPLEKRDAETQARALFDFWISRFGCPQLIIHDGDPAYCGELFQKLCKLLGTSTVQISSYHSQANGGVEIYNKVFQNILRSVLPSPTTPYEDFLPAVSLAYNTSVNKATNTSPFFLLHGCDPRLPQFDAASISPYVEDHPSDRFKELQLARRVAQENMDKAAETNKLFYDKHAKEIYFSLGEICLLHFPRSVCTTGNPRFYKPWRPVVVTRIIARTTYEVRNLYRRDKKAFYVVHANRLKKYFPLSFEKGETVPARADDVHARACRSGPGASPVTRSTHVRNPDRPGSPLYWDFSLPMHHGRQPRRCHGSGVGAASSGAAAATSGSAAAAETGSPAPAVPPARTSSSSSATPPAASPAATPPPAPSGRPSTAEAPSEGGPAGESRDGPAPGAPVGHRDPPQPSAVRQTQPVSTRKRLSSSLVGFAEGIFGPVNDPRNLTVPVAGNDHERHDPARRPSVGNRHPAVAAGTAARPAAPAGAARQTRSSGPVSDLPLPRRPPEYKKKK